MLGKLIGAVVGERAARHVDGISGTGGALLGAAVPTLLRRLGPVGLAAVLGGGYLLKRRAEKRHATQAAHPRKMGVPR